MSIVKVTGKEKISLKDIDPNSDGGLTEEEARPLFEQARDRIAKLQEKLYAEHKQSLLVVLQAIDTGGKDGTIRNLFSGVNPAGVQVWSFKVPSEWEADHDILWRYHERTPGRGMINVFNRSYFEEVLVVRVKKLVPKKVWERRYKQINNFEELLTENGTRVVKIYLHISKDEQKERLQARLDDPAKHWKFNTSDLADREYWDA
ncbi:MAG TPA: PPK2 family polyphosphate kinase, partial [Thermomicrobiales bacterium]|nr:PPK2 family polyphosphate kinase [Thermomicrobiales bacterium]